MRRIKPVGSISEFMERDFARERRLRRKKLYRSTGVAVGVVSLAAVTFLTGIDVSFASPATDQIDAKGRGLFFDIVRVGKWILVGKASIDIIKSASHGDMESSKKCFFQYLMLYIALLALPWCYDRVDEMFMTS